MKARLWRLKNCYPWIDKKLGAGKALCISWRRFISPNQKLIILTTGNLVLHWKIPTSWLYYFEIYITCASTFLSYWLSKSSTNRHNIRWMTYLQRVLHWKHKNFHRACGHVERTTKWNTIKKYFILSWFHDAGYTSTWKPIFSPTSPAIIYESSFVKGFLKTSFLIGSNPQAISS